jgi:thiosulfate/3-mercaptopyruvate sulfurtransferase
VGQEFIGEAGADLNLHLSRKLLVELGDANDRIKIRGGQMKNIFAKLIVLPLLAISVAIAPAVQAAPAQCGGHGDKNTMLVSTAWLADHLKDANLVVLAVGNKSDYDKGHIPGSLFVDYHETHLMEAPNGLSVELPPMTDLEALFGKFGVTNDSRIVLYTLTNTFSWATRIYLTLDAMGLGRQSALLDGGLPIWSKEGRPVTTEVRSVTPGKITTCQQTDVITVLDDVKANVKHAGVDIIDARASEFYTGQTKPDDQRRGHIPGAASIPFTSLLDAQGKWKSPEALAAIFQDAGVKKGDRIITYCHIGQQATAVYFVSRYLGYDVRLFDGSWEEYSKHTELPAETSGKDHP